MHPIKMREKNDPLILLSISIMFKGIIHVSKLDVIEENLKIQQWEVSFSPIWCWVTILRDNRCQRKWRKLAYYLMSFCSWPLHMLSNKFWDGIHRSWRKKFMKGSFRRGSKTLSLKSISKWIYILNIACWLAFAW